MLLLLLLFLLATPLRAETVAEVVDGDTLRLSDGRVVRLAGVRAPKPAAWERDAPFAEQARAGLAALLENRQVRLDSDGPRDRHGRLLRQLWRDDGLWLQGEVLRRGLALADPQAGDPAAELLRHEAEARAAPRGLWVLRPVLAAEAVQGFGFHIVEGRVRAVAPFRDVVYLNFGEDWRRDFTVAIAADRLAAFAAAGLDPQTLTGRTVRVRGWVEWRNGPMITADEPFQIEIF